MAERLRLMSVHAHPDDEASKGSALVAKYVSEGADATLVCCTGGELGSIQNPVMDHAHIRSRIADVRAAELLASAAIIGYQAVEMLGYRDSGMPDDPGNADPRNFAKADFGEATHRLARLIRRDRPHVLLTYSDDQGGYPHPDHLRVHDVSVAAWECAADPACCPELGEPWKVPKVYYSVWTRERMARQQSIMERKGKSSPFPADWLDRFNQDHRVTTKVDVGEFLAVRNAALRAHATQVDPDEQFWFGVSAEEMAAEYPWDDYVLAMSDRSYPLPETDLFAGLRGER